MNRAITIQELQRIVLRFSNQMFVRHHLWVNYPHEPQMMGIQFTELVPSMLDAELRAIGFVYNFNLGIWTIERAED